MAPTHLIQVHQSPRSRKTLLNAARRRHSPHIIFVWDAVGATPRRRRPLPDLLKVAASEVLNGSCQRASVDQKYTKQVNQSAARSNTHLNPTSRRPSHSPTASSLEPARSNLSPRSEWPQNRNRNHPRHREMATSRMNEVKAPQHFKTRRSHVRGHVFRCTTYTMSPAKRRRHAGPC